MKEHLEEEYISLDSLDNTQLMAQYFRNFDLDKNGQIDALELMKSLHRMNSKLGASLMGYRGEFSLTTTEQTERDQRSVVFAFRPGSALN